MRGFWLPVPAVPLRRRGVRSVWIVDLRLRACARAVFLVGVVLAILNALAVHHGPEKQKEQDEEAAISAGFDPMWRSDWVVAASDAATELRLSRLQMPRLSKRYADNRNF